MPPPPPPPPVPSGLPKAPIIKSGGGGTERGALLSSIQGGARLKKTVTNDRSGPSVAGNTNRPSPSSGGGGGGGPGGGGGGGTPALGGLFSGGMPQLRKAGSNTGGPPKRFVVPGNKPTNNISNGPSRFGQSNGPANGQPNLRRMPNGGPPTAGTPSAGPPPPPPQDSKPARPSPGVRRIESIENDRNVTKTPHIVSGINRTQPPPPPTRPVPSSNTNGRPSSMVGRPLPPTPHNMNGSVSAPMGPPKAAPPPPPRQTPGRPSAPPPPVRNTSMQRPPPPPRADPPPPPPHMVRPPPPPMSQPPSANRSTRSSLGSNMYGMDSFEQKFKFHSLNEFPHPEKPSTGAKTYPSNTRRPSVQQRRAPPPPPPR